MRISVITPCLNSVAYLAETLASVARQDWHEIEHLILDGGSTDGSVDMIRAFAAGHPAVRWWSEPDNGIGDAMNRGAARAKGDLVAFLHADDCYPGPSVLSTVVARMATVPDAVWLTGGLREIDGQGNLLRELSVRRYSYHRLLRNNIVFHPATFVNRNALLTAGGFDTGLRYAMDYDLWLRLGAVSPPVTLDCVLACFRVHSGSRSTRNRLAALEEEYQVRQRFLTGQWQRGLHSCYQILRRACAARASHR